MPPFYDKQMQQNSPMLQPGGGGADIPSGLDMMPEMDPGMGGGMDMGMDPGMGAAEPDFSMEGSSFGDPEAEGMESEAYGPEDDAPVPDDMFPGPGSPEEDEDINFAGDEEPESANDVRDFYLSKMAEEEGRSAGYQDGVVQDNKDTRMSTRRNRSGTTY